MKQKRPEMWYDRLADTPGAPHISGSLRHSPRIAGGLLDIGRSARCCHEKQVNAVEAALSDAAAEIRKSSEFVLCFANVLPHGCDQF